MKLLHELFLKAYDPDAESEYFLIRNVSICLLLLLCMLVVILLSVPLPAITSATIAAIIFFIITELLLIRQGRFKIVIPIVVISASLFPTLLVFFGKPPNAYEIYRLAAFHLFTLFLITLITYDLIYVFLSTAIAGCSFIFHFFLRTAPLHDQAMQNTESYLACGGMLVISFFIIIHIIRTHRYLFGKIETESKDNLKRARALESAYKELTLLYEEKRKSDEKYRILVETATDAIFIAQDGKIKFPNSVTLKMVDYTKKEVLKKPFSDFIHPDDRAMVEERHRLRVIGKEPPGNYSFRLINRKGKVLWVHLNSVFISWEERPATLNFMRDITLEKKREEQYRQSQKMEAMGRLSGGIAHDFNNILSGIFGYAHLAINDIADPAKATRHISQILKAGSKAAELVRQILTVSRQSKNEKAPVYMSLVVKEASKLLRASIPANIKIKDNIISKKMVLADPMQIHQVVMNLCTNAFHAMMENGGTIIVNLKEVNISAEGSIPNIGLPPGEYLKLEVSDDGCGIPKELMGKIFDPYFTTKPVGKGTGLGLAIVSGIVEEHSGYMKVYSEPGHGTSFNIFLPVIKGQETSEGTEKKGITIKGGSESIMVIDDEEDILSSVCEILENMGYRVSAFQSSKKAFETFQENQGRFDLIITDMTMPSMNGLELSKRILELRPDQKIFICTGSSEKLTQANVVEAGISGYFEKPLIIEDLLRDIRKTLDRAKQT